MFIVFSELYFYFTMNFTFRNSSDSRRSLAQIITIFQISFFRFLKMHTRMEVSFEIKYVLLMVT